MKRGNNIIAIAGVLALATIIAIKANSTPAPEEEMHIVNISIEIPDAQYLALKRRAARVGGLSDTKMWAVDDEITLTAQAAVTLIAEEEIKREEQAIRNAQIIDDFIVDDVPIHVVAAQKEQDTPTLSEDPEGEPAAEDLSQTTENKEHGKTTSYETDLFLRCVQAEAGDQSLECKTATAEVIMNRVASPEFPDTIAEVILQPGQFAVVSNGRIDTAVPDLDTVTAVEDAINGSHTIPADYVYFNYAPIGRDVVQIGGHYFGR